MYDFHIHSNYSDGSATIDEIARRAKELKLKRIAIVDHSVELPFGLTESKAKRRQDEIDEAMATYGLKIYSGIECGIDASGSILLPDFDFDFVVASVHEFVDGEKYYSRVMLCIEKNDIDVIGHPFSPMFGFTSTIKELDLKLISLAKEYDVAIELNSSHESPPDNFLELCSEVDIKYSIGSDAHTLSKVGAVRWSLERAKRYMTRGCMFIP